MYCVKVQSSQVDCGLQACRCHGTILNQQASLCCTVNAIYQHIFVSGVALYNLQRTCCHVIVHRDNCINLAVCCCPVFHQSHSFVLVPVCEVFAYNLNVRSLVKEYFLPCDTSLVSVEVAGGPLQNNNLRIFGNLCQCQLSVNLCLIVRIGIDRGCTFNAFNSGVGCDCNQTCLYNFFNVGSLCFAVVGLHDDCIVAVCDCVFDCSVFLCIVSLTIEYLQLDVIILICCCYHFVCQPCCEGVRLRSCNIRYLVGFIAVIAACGITAAAACQSGCRHSQCHKCC